MNARTWAAIQFAQEVVADPAHNGSDMGHLARAVLELLDDANHWVMVADGINHDRRCINDATNTDPAARMCMRCEVEHLRGELQRVTKLANAPKWVPPDWHHPRGDF
jgi:hypothetical protein